MSRVLLCASKGTSVGDWETMKRIAGTIERDARDYVWQVYVPCPNTFEIDRCRTSDFGIHKPGYGLGYYATIITDFDEQKRVELAEHYVGYEQTDGCDTQINIFGYFASAVNAAKNLLRFGNTTEDKRKPIEIYK